MLTHLSMAMHFLVSLSQGAQIYFSRYVGGTNSVCVTHIPQHDLLQVQLPTL